MAHSCCSKHYQVELILEEYREGITTKSEAAQCFLNIGIDENYDFSEFLPEVSRDIRAIICSNKKTTRAKTIKNK